MADSPPQKRLAKLSAKETLTATILHELTQPLASSAMHVAGLKRMAELPDVPLDRETLSYGLDRLDQAIRRCTEIISRIRSLVMDDRPVRTATGMDTIFGQALRAIEDVSGRNHADIEVDASWAPDPAWCDPVQIEQVIVNLLLNAISATRSQPMPRITVRAISRRTLVRGRFIEISVTDNGPGIPPGQDEVLFRPFLDNGNGGSSLGLAICRSLVEIHGGDIWYEHGPAGGASLHFTLPQAQRHGRKPSR